MVTDKLNTTELFSSLDKASTELLELITSLTQHALNTIPYTDSWTAAQLAAHVSKSNSSINLALKMDAQPAERNAGERVEELRKIFLDFSVKFQSPEFIIPTEKAYEKEILITKLKRS